jgi:hypothetical protein
VALNQRDWAENLPAIEFVMNSVSSEMMGFSPFYLNYGQWPWTMIWDNKSEYSGVCAFAERMKLAIMSAHDAITAAQVCQTEQANKRRRECPIKVGELLYLSTRDLALPRGCSRKLSPKYIGPYQVLKVVEEGTLYRLELPPELKWRGLNPVFHVSKLCVHVLSDDRLFPGHQLHQLHQLPGFRVEPAEWEVDRIVSHSGRGDDALLTFLLLWRYWAASWILS